MSAAPASRALLRQSRYLLRRNNFRQASTTSEAASKAQETGKQAVSKASEGLSRVQSSAASAASKPRRMGAVSDCFQRSANGASPITNALRNPRTIMSSASSATSSMNPESLLASMRNVNGRQLTVVGIVFAEILGFFTVGEMVGRMKIVGYHGEPHHAH